MTGSPFVTRGTSLRSGLALIALWTAELWWIQHETLGFDYPTAVQAIAVSGGWRLMLDAMFATAAVLLLPRLALVLTFIAWAVAAQGLWVYHSLFDRALGWTTISTQLGEGWEGLGGDAGLLLDGPAALLVALLLVKVGLGCAGPRRPRLAAGTAVAAIYLAAALVGAVFVDPLEKLRYWCSVDRLAHTHGYLATWAGEAIHVDQGSLTAEAIARKDVVDTSVLDLIGPLEPGEVGDVVFLQIESLGMRVLEHRQDGAPAMPFVRALADRSLLFRARPIHDTGSADTDFVWLTGDLPSARVVTYRLLDYPYGETLPRKARRDGMRTVFVHGNSGDFFNRRHALLRMGFDELWFAEELIAAGVDEQAWGVADGDALSLLTTRIEASERTLAYFIGLTSHYPFRYVPEAHADPRGNKETPYLTSMRYVDAALERFVVALRHRTLVVLFGDHEVPSHDLSQGDDELVPVIVHITGDDDPWPDSSSLPVVSMHGVATWIHRWLEHP